MFNHRYTDRIHQTPTGTTGKGYRVTYLIPATNRTPAHIAHDPYTYPTIDRAQARKAQILRTYGQTMIQISAIH